MSFRFKLQNLSKMLSENLRYKDNKIQDVLGSDLMGEENFIR